MLPGGGIKNEKVNSNIIYIGSYFFNDATSWFAWRLKPKPRLIAQNETHEFYEEPQTHTIIKVNKRTGEVVDLQKTREQLFK